MSKSCAREASGPGWYAPADRRPRTERIVATYDKGDHHLLLMFANSHTTKVDSFDYIQNRRNPDLSWSDTRETVDSAATVRALLGDNEGVLFAHTSWRYYSIPE